MNELIASSNGGTTEVDVSAFERRSGVNLPHDYRAFIREHNGAKIVDNTLRLDAALTDRYTLTLRALRGISPQEQLFQDLEGAQLCFSDRITPEFLLLGSDWGGNQFLMLRTLPHTIYWWDHDDEEAVEIADNFSDFITRIIPTPPEPETDVQKFGRTALTEADVDEYLRSHDVTADLCYEAAKNGNLDLLKICIRRGFPMGHVLRIAAMSGNFEVFDFLVSSGFPINGLMGDGKTALDWVSWNPDYVRQLREKGAKGSKEI